MRPESRRPLIKRRAQLPSAPGAASQERTEPLLEKAGLSPSSQIGSLPSRHEGDPPPGQTGALPSSQTGVVGLEPHSELEPASQPGSPEPAAGLEATWQTRVEPSLERVGVEASSQTGSLPSAHANAPPLGIGALPSSQLDRVWLAAVGPLAAGAFVRGYRPRACLPARRPWAFGLPADLFAHARVACPACVEAAVEQVDLRPLASAREGSSSSIARSVSARAARRVAGMRRGEELGGTGVSDGGGAKPLTPL